MARRWNQAPNPDEWVYRAPHESEVPERVWRAYHMMRCEFGKVAATSNVAEFERRRKQACGLLRDLAASSLATAALIEAESVAADEPGGEGSAND